MLIDLSISIVWCVRFVDCTIGVFWGHKLNIVQGHQKQRSGPAFKVTYMNVKTEETKYKCFSAYLFL